MVQCFSKFVFFFYLITPLTTLDLYIYIKCQINQLSKDIKSLELQIIDIYLTRFRALKRRDYKILSSTQN